MPALLKLFTVFKTLNFTTVMSDGERRKVVQQKSYLRCVLLFVLVFVSDVHILSVDYTQR